MGILGGLLIFLALPLFTPPWRALPWVGYSMSERKNRMWLRLGLLLVAVGAVIVALGMVTN